MKKLNVQNIVKIQSVAILILFAGLFSSLYIQMNPRDASDEIIRTKGIVVVDENGKERILIGAPIPTSKDRVRDDLKKAQAAWGADDMLELNKIWDWYEEMNHECYGMLILDDNGHDRLAVGSPAPDPNIGVRVGPATGVTIHDSLGFERSGYSLMNVNGKDRMVLGLDNPGSSEGATLSVLEDGTVGLSIFKRESRNGLFLGAASEGNYLSPGRNKYFGLALTDSTRNVKLIDMKEE